MDNKTDLNVWELRRSYTKSGLLEADLPENPFKLLKRWIEQALISKVPEPNAMSLATVKKDQVPDVRMILLKEIEEDTILFFTNYRSEKAEDLKHCPAAACCFWWAELERQVRLRGSVEKVARGESTAYFASRPRESQLGAWASDQSREVQGREALELKFEDFKKKYEGKEIPVPAEWGGYRIRVTDLEFWQGRPGRLHDRILFCRTSSGWSRKRLAP
ncbi:MAG: pyridoxamine 5'-phosphate oxidase [Balneolaceae bacterium]